MDFPIVSKELIEMLEAMFPDRMPDVDVPLDLDQVNIMRGRIDIIRLLRDHHDEQNTLEE